MHDYNFIVVRVGHSEEEQALWNEIIRAVQSKIRIAKEMTEMGHPIDVAVDWVRITTTVPKKTWKDIVVSGMPQEVGHQIATVLKGFLQDDKIAASKKLPKSPTGKD